MQTPQVTTTTPARGRKHPNPGMAAMPFPTLPPTTDTNQIEFWLSAWQRDTAAREALIAHTTTTLAQDKKDDHPALQLALVVAMQHARSTVMETTKILKDVGGLLFAHAATTRLTTTGAAA